MTAPAARWQVSATPGGAVQGIRSALGLSEAFSRVLVARGYDTPAAARAFLDRSHGKASGETAYPALREAVDALTTARDAGRPVAVFGDYDVDGIAGTAILADALAEFGMRMPAGPGGFYYIPNRAAEGYGLNCQAIQTLRDRGAGMLVTVDCGTSAVEEVAFARSLGMEVVVTDHHQPGGQRPAAQAIVNPWVGAADAPATPAGDSDQAPCGLVDEPCGALVAFELAQAVAPQVEAERLGHWMDLVALATVADIVPLLGRNRSLVHSRLAHLEETAHPGLRSLLEVGRCLEAGRRLTARDLAFVLAPRINALGRMARGGDGFDAIDAVRALAYEPSADTAEIVLAMDSANRARQQQEQFLAGQAEVQVAAMTAGGPPALVLPPALVIAGEDSQGYHEGLLGIVASRLAQKYWRPAAVLRLDGGTARGSARGVPGYNIYQALADCADLLDRFGGHAQAGGFGIAAARVDEFRQQFGSAIAAQGVVERVLPVDAQVSLAEAGEPLVHELALLEPCGHGNPPAALAALGCEVRSVREMSGGKHLALTLSQQGTAREAVAFNVDPGTFAACRRGKQVDVVFAPEMHAWNCEPYVRLVLRDARPAQAAGAHD